MKNTALLCLSSPEGDSNYYSSLMGLKRPNGESFFQVINCFQICAKCLKLERVKQILCTHVKSTTPWLSKRKINELKILYKASPEDAIREFGGIVVSDYLPALRKDEIEKSFKSDRITTLAPPKFIFTCCDPTGGGPSQLSIASGYYSNTGDVVVRISNVLFRKIYTLCTQYKSMDHVYAFRLSKWTVFCFCNKLF